MARVFIDGFESGSLGMWDAVNNATLNNASELDGVYCLNCAGAYCNVRKNLPAADEYFLAFLIGVRSNSDQNIMRFYNSTTALGSLFLNAGKIEARRGTSTVLGISTTTLTSYTTHRIEIRYKPHASDGLFQVKIDGILEIDYSGQTAASTLQIDSIFFGSDSGNWSHYFDNVIVDSANWIGNTKIQAVAVSGAGGYAQFTPSTGSNYQTVDEIPPNDTDYNETAIVDKVDSFAHAALSGTIGSIKCVQVQVRGKLVGNPTPSKIAPALRIDSTMYYGTAQSLGSSPKAVVALWETNPNTSAAWTESEVNNAEIGYKSST